MPVLRSPFPLASRLRPLGLALLALVGSSPLARGQDTSRVRFYRDTVEVRVELGGESNRRVRLENLGADPVKLTRLEVDAKGTKVFLRPNLQERPEPLPEDGRVDLRIEPSQFVRLELQLSSEGLEDDVYTGEVRAYLEGLEAPIVLPVVLDVQPEEGEDYDPTTSKWVPDKLVTEGPLPRIVFDEYVHDFGECLAGERLQTSMKFRNEGEGDLIIQTVRRQCHCSMAGLILPAGPVPRARLKREPIGILKPGEEGELLIELDTAGQPGDLKKQVYVYTNDPSRDHMTTLIIGAEVKNPFTINGGLSFGEVRPGEGAEKKLILSGLGIGEFEIVGHRMPAPSPLDLEMRRVRRPRLPGDDHWELIFRVREDAPFGEQRDRIVLDIEHEFIREYALTYAVTVLPDVLFNATGPDALNMGLVRGQLNREGRFQVENHNPAVPYLPTSVEVIPAVGNAEPFEAEIVEKERGVRYEIVFRVVGKPLGRHLKGQILVRSEHPQLREKRLTYSGLYQGD